MSERTLNVALFAGIAASVGCVFAFVILKAFKVKSPFENKSFPYIVGGFMFLAYVVRTAIR